MPYSPTNAFATGDVVSATKLNQNISGIGAYLLDGIDETTDVVDGSVDTGSIVRPSFKQVTDLNSYTLLETGSIWQTRVPALDANIDSYIQQLPVTTNGFIAGPFSPQLDSAGAQKEVSTWRVIPKTGITFWVEKASIVLIEYSGEIASPDGNSTLTLPIINKAGIVVDGTLNVSSLVVWLECDKSTTWEQDNMRRVFQTHCQVSLTRGWHDVGIVAGVQSNISFVGAINGLVEVINISNV